MQANQSQQLSPRVVGWVHVPYCAYSKAKEALGAAQLRLLLVRKCLWPTFQRIGARESKGVRDMGF